MNCFKFTKTLALFFIAHFTTPVAFCQLSVSPNQTAAFLASKITGAGISVSSPVLTCPGISNGTFVSSGTALGIDSGILLTTGKAINASGAESFFASTNTGAAGDAALTTLAGAATFDACILQFDFVPSGDTVSFKYVFGSEEYLNSVCGIYNDAFAFFISGPGITGAQNMALIPGTNIPVTVNSVNDGIPGSGTGTNIANCTVMGPGAPFTSYYVDNTGGTQLSYKGFTKVFTAMHPVTPCNTYHLKLTIADAGNALFDSGVFIEGGSLKTNSFAFDHSDSIGSTIAGIPNAIVKGCAPATIKITSGQPVVAAQTLHFVTGGTAVNGVDYTGVPDSITIPAGDSSAVVTITGLPTAAAGTTTLIWYLVSPFQCGIIDSIKLNILDTPTATILTPDTSICSGSSFLIRVNGTAGLAYDWSPATGISDPNAMQPTATPTVTTIYIMTAAYPGTTCTPISRSLTIHMDSVSVSILTPDTLICQGQSVHIRVNGDDAFTYNWLPIAGVDSINIKEPTIAPAVTTTYTVNAIAPAGCIASASVTISLLTISANIVTPDTAVCRGRNVQIIATGDNTLSYQWLPTAGIPASTVLMPLVSADTPAMYYLTYTGQGCNVILDSIYIDVQPNPTVYIGGNRSVCQFDTIHINGYVSPSWYTHYNYSWAPGTSLDDSTISVVVFSGRAPGSTEQVLTVATPAGCKGADSAAFIVRPGNFAGRDTSYNICPHDSVQFMPVGGVSYHWSPGVYLSDSLSAAPWAHSVTSETYTAIAASEYGCLDTVRIHVAVMAAAVLYLGDSATIYPGESYQLNTQTNCTSFTWFPPAGLDNSFIANPLASPQISTKYIVHGATEWGCSTTDSINIFVDPSSLLALPNAFAPGNGPNNSFKIIKHGIATLNYFRIYNRWGNLVYEGKNIDDGWDGTFNGKPQPFDAYVYEVEATTSTGTVFRKHGNVTLIR